MQEKSLKELFRLVDTRDRLILTAHFLVGWSYAEIGKELGISRQRVWEITERAVKRLEIHKDRLRHLFSIHRLLRRGGER